MDIILIISGLVLLFFGGEGLVRGSVGIAERMGISTLLVSLVVIGFGTSMPELLVCVQAALSGHSDLALGNVVGSNIANTFLILGVGAVLAPMVCSKDVILRDSVAVIVASAMLAALTFFEVIDWRAGIIMLLALCAYLYTAYRLEKSATAKERSENAEIKKDVADDMSEPQDSFTKAIILVIIGLIALVAGANFLVSGASSIARSFGISEAVIGLSLVALGTSLPELATAVIASIKGQSDVIIGNVLGSNLFNILSILGTTALIAPLSMGGRIAEFDVWIMLGSAVMLYPVIRIGRNINRLEGAAFLTIYAGYIAFMYVS